MKVKLKAMYLWIRLIGSFLVTVKKIINKIDCWLFKKRCELEHYKAIYLAEYTEYLYNKSQGKLGGKK